MMLSEALAAHLKANGYDGLLEVDCECACEVSDLMPCGNSPLDVAECGAAWKIVTDPNDCGCGNGCDWHMTLVKPRRSNERSVVRCQNCNRPVPCIVIDGDGVPRCRDCGVGVCQYAHETFERCPMTAYGWDNKNMRQCVDHGGPEFKADACGECGGTGRCDTSGHNEPECSWCEGDREPGEECACTDSGDTSERERPKVGGDLIMPHNHVSPNAGPRPEKDFYRAGGRLAKDLKETT